MYDLTKLAALATFPWESVYEGLAKSRKTMTTFYGDVHSTKFTHTLDARWSDRDQWRWYNALKHGVNVAGFNVNVTALPAEYMQFGKHWWARSHEPIWVPTDNARHFGELRQWIKNSGIFKHTGRQTFFVQTAGQSSPEHVDFEPADVPENLRAPGEFIWLTPPDRPKHLSVKGVAAPWCCWFNHFDRHGTEAESDTRWSLRIDGGFTDEFKASLPTSESLS